MLKQPRRANFVALGKKTKDDASCAATGVLHFGDLKLQELFLHKPEPLFFFGLNDDRSPGKTEVYGRCDYTSFMVSCGLDGRRLG